MIDMSKKSDEIKNKNVFFLGLGIGIGAFLVLNVGFGWGSLLEMSQGCVGIDKFYSNTTFNDDLYTVLNRTNFSLQSIKSPAQLWDGEGVDCETISTTMMCLSYYYDDVECLYYHRFVLDVTMFNKTEREYDYAQRGHLGIRCRQKDYRGRWSDWLVKN